MKNILTILKEMGIEVPKDKETDLDKAVAENYKTVADYDKQKEKLEAANNTIKANDAAMKDLQTKLDEFKGVDVSGLNQRIKDLETEKENIQKDYDAKIADRDFDDLVKASMVQLGLARQEAAGNVVQLCPHSQLMSRIIIFYALNTVSPKMVGALRP